MKIQLWNIGKPHESYIQQGVEDFTKRICNYFPCSWTILPAPKNAGLMKEDDLKKNEAKIILPLIEDTDFLVLLDEKGKQLDSSELATFIQQRANESKKRLIFLIGGAYGVDDAIMRRANYTWSLSKLVFPHMLVRLMLAEQVYRACTILRNEKYHHS
jgi:23S rRNA (pseudouridine1915-N3)-methyltransferase